MGQVFRIGTRGSRLALVQTQMVADRLRGAHPRLVIEIKEIRTSGDWNSASGETRLAEAEGGKGLFAREIEMALQAGEIDCGVHSMKDMPSFLPQGLVIDHMLERADARDAFLASKAKRLADLPEGATLGTSSLRRQAFVLAKRPDLRILPLRGNVPTRIEKLRAGQVDSTLLALAGLARLGLEGEAACVLEPEDMLPAAGQGAVGIEIRKTDQAARALLDPLHHRATGLRVAAERGALQILNGSCRTPVGAYATLEGARLSLTVAVASEDGRQFFEDRLEGDVRDDADAASLGETLGARLKPRIPPGILE